jgi:pimeloyl-ACP methyl ester carboxylesterase
MKEVHDNKPAAGTAPSGSERRPRLLAWLRRHPWRAAALTAVACFVLLNVLAYQHARSMLNYSASGNRTPSPQTLSVWQKIGVLVCGPSIPRPENTRSPHDLGLPSETVSIATSDGPRLEGWLVVPPSPRGTVLLFHGYAASRATLLEQGQALHDVGFAAFLVDFRGSGGSDGSATTLGYHEAQDVAAALRHARALNLPRPLVLYGQSMGGAALLRSIAVLDVHADAVILESVFGRMLGAVCNRFGLMGVPSFPAAQLLVFWGGVQAGFSAFDHNPVDYARACNCPALVLHGEEDRHARPAEGRAIYENLAGTKQMVELREPGTRHYWRRARNNGRPPSVSSWQSRAGSAARDAGTHWAQYEKSNSGTRSAARRLHHL